MKRKQQTIQKKVSLHGIGLFTGKNVTLTLVPAEMDTGIRIQRTDIPSSSYLCDLESVDLDATSRCTTLGEKNCSVMTVEHLLACLYSHKIDNLLIEISGPEIPIGDGSAKPFDELVEQAGIEGQKKEKKIYMLNKPLYWQSKDMYYAAFPAEEFRLSYTLHYDQPIPLTQYYSFREGFDDFSKEIAPCRTFSLYEEIAPLIQQGMFRGGDLQKAVVLKEGKAINPGGLRFPEELARHKILDMLGDFSLIGENFYAHIMAVRTGHATNIRFGKMIKEALIPV